MKNPETHTETQPNFSTETVDIDPAVRAILRTLDVQIGQYDMSTQMRLNDARARAVAATRAKVPFWRSTPILAAGFALSAAYSFVILTQPHVAITASEIEATALYEATFGAGIPDDEAASPGALFDANVDQTALDETVLDEAVPDETVVANNLEFYAWLSKSTNAERARSGSGS